MQHYSTLNSSTYMKFRELSGYPLFHQLKNVTKKYLNEFGKIENIPHLHRQIYELATDLILSEPVIHLSVNYRNIMEMFSDGIKSKASEKVFEYIKEIYPKNRGLLEAGFTPETNNVMEQLFSMINDFINQVQSFKTKNVLANFFHTVCIYE
jgi:hypothetical protein